MSRIALALVLLGIALWGAPSSAQLLLLDVGPGGAGGGVGPPPCTPDGSDDLSNDCNGAYRLVLVR